VIAITTYTEPIPVDVSVSEPPFIRNRDEKEDRIEQSGSGSFAEMLAGLLNKTEAVNYSSGEDGLVALSSLSNEEDGNRRLAEIFPSDAAEKVFDASALNKDSAGIENIDIDLSDAAIENEYQNILDTDRLFSNSLSLIEAEQETLAQEIDGETVNLFSDIASKTGLSSGLNVKDLLAAALPEKIANDSAPALNAQTLASSDINAKKLNGEESAILPNNKNNSARKDDAQLSFNNDTNRLSGRDRTQGENAGLLNKRGDNEGQGRLDEFRKNQRRDKVSFEVRDMRTASNAGAANPNTLTEMNTGRVSQQASSLNSGEISLDLRLPENANISQAQTTWDIKAGSALENMLARELHQNFNGDIVRHASIALRDGGAGTIKIALHPETLGNVKIHIELTDNKITGRIVVESADALNAFRKELSALEQAFRESGFADANLDLSLTADGAGNHGGERNESSHSSQYAASGYEEGYEQKTPSIIDIFFGKSETAVNMLA